MVVVAVVSFPVVKVQYVVVVVVAVVVVRQCPNHAWNVATSWLWLLWLLSWLSIQVGMLSCALRGCYSQWRVAAAVMGVVVVWLAPEGCHPAGSLAGPQRAMFARGRGIGPSTSLVLAWRVRPVCVGRGLPGCFGMVPLSVAEVGAAI